MSGDGELREMQRVAIGPDGLDRLLSWLGRRFNGSAVLIDRAYETRPKVFAGELSAHIDGAVATGIRSVLEGHRRSVSLDTANSNVRVVAIGGNSPSPALVVSGRLSPTTESSAVIADAVSLLRLRWRLDQAEDREKRVRRAEERAREAVLHLLMTGEAGTARRVGGALSLSQ